MDFRMATAILIDGGFFLRRYRSLCGDRPPNEVAIGMHKMCYRHLREAGNHDNQNPSGRSNTERRLFRIFYYDCPPLSKKVHHPVTGMAVDFSKTRTARWRLEFFEELKRLRKVALRLGDLNEKSGAWTVHHEPMKELLNRRIRVEDLKEDDVHYDVKQKGVDMRIGLDIASMCYKRFVDQIILVAGDSDFVPAAKLARREGVDFILDPMWAPIRPDLFEHIDGLRSVLPRPKRPADDASDTMPDKNPNSKLPPINDYFGAGIDESSENH